MSKGNVILGTLGGDEYLIQKVRALPVLYDSRNPEYKEQGAKNAAWHELGVQLGMNADVCRGRWRSLRDRFVREKKAMILGTKPQDPKNSNKVWPLLEPLSFLWEFIMHRPMSKRGSNRFSRPVSDEQLLQEQQQEDEDEEEEGEEFQWIAVGTDSVDDDEPQIVLEETNSSLVLPKNNPRKRFRGETSPPRISPVVSPPRATPVIASACSLRDKNSPERSSPPPPTATDEEDSLFCRSVTQTLRRLPARRKALAKLRILQALYDAEFGQEGGGAEFDK